MFPKPSDVELCDGSLNVPCGWLNIKGALYELVWSPWTSQLEFIEGDRMGFISGYVGPTPHHIDTDTFGDFVWGRTGSLVQSIPTLVGAVQTQYEGVCIVFFTSFPGLLEVCTWIDGSIRMRSSCKIRFKKQYLEGIDFLLTPLSKPTFIKVVDAHPEVHPELLKVILHRKLLNAGIGRPAAYASTLLSWDLRQVSDTVDDVTLFAKVHPSVMEDISAASNTIVKHLRVSAEEASAAWEGGKASRSLHYFHPQFTTR